MLEQQINQIMQSDIDIDRCDITQDNEFMTIKNKAGGTGGIIVASLFLLGFFFILLSAISHFSILFAIFALIFCPLLLFFAIVFIFSSIEKGFDKRSGNCYLTFRLFSFSRSKNLELPTSEKGGKIILEAKNVTSAKSGPSVLYVVNVLPCNFGFSIAKNRENSLEKILEFSKKLEEFLSLPVENKIESLYR